MMIIRFETQADIVPIQQINEQAFGRPQEGLLVDRLRERGNVTLSLVAELAGRVVGHVLFCPVVIEGDCAGKTAVSLGPIAVAPAVQKQRIGGQLIGDGLARCRQLGHAAVVLIGHPTYYPRFGFVPASRFGLRCEYDVPDEVFMAYELLPGVLDGCEGLVRYAPEFAGV